MAEITAGAGGALGMPVNLPGSGEISRKEFMPVAEVCDDLHLAVFLVKHFFVLLGIKHADPVPVEIRQRKLFIKAQPLTAELFVAEVVD